MSTVNFPIMYIPDPVKGRPIFNGQLFIGIPDLDPEIFTNQKQVNYIQENGDAVPADQPISLSAGGVPTYNGTSVVLDITGNYSLKILDKQGAQIYYIANTAPSEGGGNVFIYTSDEQILTNDQLVVLFDGVTVADSTIHVNSDSGDRGELFEGDDYEVTGGSEITLTSSFNEGTIISAASLNVTSIDDDPTRNHEFATVAEMTSSEIIFSVGKSLHVIDINTDYVVTAGASPRAESPDLTTGLYAAFNSTPFVSNDQISGTQDTKGLSVVGCAVRITNNGEGVDNTFAIIDDSQHDPINSINVTGGLNTISVFHEQPFSDVVGTCVVVPDETLVQRGIMVGGSIAADVSVITMAKRHQFTLDWQAGALDIADLIVDPFMDSTRYVSVDNTGGNGAYRIIHPRTTDGIRTINGQNRTSPDSYIVEISDTTIDIFPYKSVTINCSFDGAVWTVTGGQSAVTTALATIGVTCANVGPTITITHPATLGTNTKALATTGIATDFFYINIVAETTTTTAVALTDDTGVAQTPVAGDNFNIRLEDILWLFGLSIVDIGIIKLSPTLDFKDISTSNNFWLLGNHWALR